MMRPAKLVAFFLYTLTAIRFLTTTFNYDSQIIYILAYIKWANLHIGGMRQPNVDLDNGVNTFVAFSDF